MAGAAHIAGCHRMGDAVSGGRHHWIAQRVSAIALLLLIVAMASDLPSLSSVMAWRGWLASVENGGAMMALLVLVWWHWQLGMRVIVDDYVSGSFLPLVRRLVWVAAVISALLGVTAVMAIMMGV